MRWQPEEAFLTVTLPPGHHRTGLKRHVAHGTVRWTNLRGGSNHLRRAHPKAEIKLQKSRWPGKRGSSLTKCMLQPMSIIAFMQPRSAACLSSDRLTAFSYGEHRRAQPLEQDPGRDLLALHRSLGIPSGETAVQASGLPE